MNTRFLSEFRGTQTKCTHQKERSRQRERCCTMSVTPPQKCTAAAAGECNVAQLSEDHWKPRNAAKMTQEFKRPRIISTTMLLLTLLVKQQGFSRGNSEPREMDNNGEDYTMQWEGGPCFLSSTQLLPRRILQTMNKPQIWLPKTALSSAA